MNAPIRRLPARFAYALLVFLGLASFAQAAPQENLRTAPWSEGIVKLAESLAVQDGGRVKPLHTYAGFTLLRINGKRSVKTTEGERLTPVEWLLDTLFFPEAAADYPVFIVQNGEVIESIGVALDGKKKRDRYSFNELKPGISRLFQLARGIGGTEERYRSSVQQQIYVLAVNVDAYSQLITHMDYARAAFEVPPGAAMAELFDDQKQVSFSEVLKVLGPLSDRYRALLQKADRSEEERVEQQGIGTLFQEVSDLSGGTASLALIPPNDTVEGLPGWLSPAELLEMAFAEGSLDPAYAETLAGFENLAQHRSDPGAFETQLEATHATLTGLADARGEYDAIGLEVTYYKSKVMSRSLMMFVLAFLLMAFMWLRPRNKLLYGATAAMVVLPTLLLAAGIVMRCVIRSRPPVTTLYETVLFVTVTGAVVAILIEFVNRQRIALSAAVILGTIGMFIANGYEIMDKQDTMPSLVAVLDTNFWLATHVTCITIGYSAGMLAALLASVYLLAKLVGWKRGEREFFRTLGRMVYGVIAFGLLFSLVGTILGGIWANDSWGRFWGWDPKENGALLIVISQIAIIHARMGGYLREHGVCMAAAFGGTIIGFSWWGVNLLGVGLHSYGFTSGISKALWTYYVVQWSIVGSGALTWHLERVRLKAAKAAVHSGQSKPKHGIEGVPG